VRRECERGGNEGMSRNGHHRRERAPILNAARGDLLGDHAPAACQPRVNAHVERPAAAESLAAGLSDG